MTPLEQLCKLHEFYYGVTGDGTPFAKRKLFDDMGWIIFERTDSYELREFDHYSDDYIGSYTKATDAIIAALRLT